MSLWRVCHHPIHHPSSAPLLEPSHSLERSWGRYLRGQVLNNSFTADRLLPSSFEFVFLCVGSLYLSSCSPTLPVWTNKFIIIGSYFLPSYHSLSRHDNLCFSWDRAGKVGCSECWRFETAVCVRQSLIQTHKHARTHIHTNAHKRAHAHTIPYARSRGCIACLLKCHTEKHPVW